MTTQISKPGPVSTPATDTYWTEAGAGQLMIQRCAACGRFQHYPGAICRRCWGTALSWQAARGTGTVWTFTVVGIPGHPAWQAEVPYVLALVELDEGPRLMTNIVGSDRHAVAVGSRVRLAPPADGQPPLQFVLSK